MHKKNHKTNNNKTTNYEQLLKQYLNERGWPYIWQLPILHTLPDAILINNNYQPIALIKITYSKNLNPKNIQLLQHKYYTKLQLPSMLITPYNPLTQNNSNIQLLKKHTHISAIATFTQISALDTLQQLYENNYLNEELYPIIQSIIQMLKEKYPPCKIYNPKKHNLKKLIPNADLTLTTLHTFCNPYATTPWPKQLTGIYDTTYSWQPSRNTFLPTYNPTTNILKRYAAQLLAGSVSIPIKNNNPSTQQQQHKQQQPLTKPPTRGSNSCVFMFRPNRGSELKPSWRR